MALEEDLERWRAAGLVTDEQVQRIVAHEQARGSSDRRGIIAEAIGYVGAALAVGAVFLLLREVWVELILAGRLTLIGLLTVVAGAAGIAVARDPRGPARRLASVLTAAAAVGAAWFAAVLLLEGLEARQGPVAIAGGAAALLVSGPALLRRPAVPLQLTVFAAVEAVALGLLQLPQLTPEPVWSALLAWSLAIAWLLLGRAGVLRPAAAAVVLGGAVALVAMQVGSFEHRTALLSLGVVTAGVLVVLAVAGGGTPPMVLGGIGAFVFVPQLTFELFGDAIGAPATLLVIGLLLVLVAVALGRLRHEVSDERAGSSSGSSLQDEAPPPPRMGT